MYTLITNDIVETSDLESLLDYLELTELKQFLIVDALNTKGSFQDDDMIIMKEPDNYL
jgi:hypothetical protein